MTDDASAYIQTTTGRRFYPFNPRVADVCLFDIAHALANTCRFGGHSCEFYSVAQHSVLVSQTVEPALARWGLLHDAAEAYIVDVPRPLKKHPAFAAYRAAEEAVLAVIAEAFGLQMPVPPEVKLADATLLATEAGDLMPPDEEMWGGLPPPLSRPIEVWTPERSKHVFLRRAFDLGIRA